MDLVRLCKSKHSSITKVADAIGIRRSTIYRFSSKETARLDVLMILAEYFDMDPYDIWNDIFYKGEYRDIPFSEVVKVVGDYLPATSMKKLLGEYCTYRGESRKHAFFDFYLYYEYLRVRGGDTMANRLYGKRVTDLLNVRKLRKQEGFSLAEFSRKTGVHARTIRLIEDGSLCTVMVCMSIAETLNVSPLDLIADRGTNVLSTELAERVMKCYDLCDLDTMGVILTGLSSYDKDVRNAALRKVEELTNAG